MADEPVTHSERVRHYLVKAEEALQLAELAQTETAKAEFIRLAASWRVLAKRIEKTLPN
jgi:hypothetical protein